METIFSLPGPAVARALRTTAKTGTLSKVYLTRYKNRPLLMSSDGARLTLNFLDMPDLRRSYALSLRSTLGKAPFPAMLKHDLCTVCLEDDFGKLKWDVCTPTRQSIALADSATKNEVLETEDSYVPDFDSVILSAYNHQKNKFDHKMSVATAKLIKDTNLGDAIIYGSLTILIPYCIRFPKDPNLFILAMSAEWTHLGEGAPETPGTWSIP